jgi:sugar diacid utilization regulator
MREQLEQSIVSQIMPILRYSVLIMGRRVLQLNARTVRFQTVHSGAHAVSCSRTDVDCIR